MSMPTHTTTTKAEQDKPEIMVSVLAVAYNHEAWIARALESFIMQMTDFNFEILVHDDASTDRTVEIIREYEKKYPGLVKPVLQTKNQFSQGNSPVVLLAAKAKGKYLALCECDDYWTDPLKLNKQVALLEANPECSMCVTMTEVHSSKNGQEYVEKVVGDDIDKRFLSPNDICENYLHTSTYLLSANIFSRVIHVWDNATLYDRVLLFIMAKEGKIAFIKEITSVYSKIGLGICSSIKNNDTKLCKMLCEQYESIYRYGNSWCRKKVSANLVPLYLSLLLGNCKRHNYREMIILFSKIVFISVIHVPLFTVRYISSLISNKLIFLKAK